MSELSVTLVPGYVFAAGETITPAKLNLIAAPAIKLDGTISGISIADASVTTAKLADANVTTAKLADASVTTSKLVDANVTAAKLAAAAVGTATLIDASVTAAKLAADLAGFILPYAGAGTPTGWLSCDGQAVSRATYANLFTAIATTWGAGDGATTFNLPNLNGRTLVHAGTGSFAATFTADSTTDQLTVAAQSSLFTGTIVQVSNAGGGLPAPLLAATNYYVIAVSGTVVKLATSLANAQAGTAIDITTNGTGTQTLTVTLTARTLGTVLGEETHALTTAEMLSHTHAATFTSTAAGVKNVAQGAGTDAGTSTTISATGGGGAHNNLPPAAVVRMLIKI